MFLSVHERWSSTKQTFDSLQTTSKYAVIGIGISIVSVFGGALYARRKTKKWEQEQTPMLDRYWSRNYQEARNKFRSLCQNITDCKTHSLGVDPIHDLTIDLCFVPGNSKSSSSPPHKKQHLVIHMSGTHGVEGYAGSATQCRLLEDIANDENCCAQRPYDILFVHAINAYGMSEGRRFNRYNVDLNRNALISPTQWKEVKSRQPNVNGFDTIHAAVMDSIASYLPRYPWTDLKLWYKMLLVVLRFGRSFAARAIVNGQYHRATSIFYGGFQLQNELKCFFNFLTDECQNVWNVNLTSNTYQKLTVIDVHTGLGPKGIDSLLTTDHAYIDKLLKIPQLPSEYVQNKHRLMASNQTQSTQLSQIYSGGVGGVKNAVIEVFTNECKDETSLDCLALTQEFGTVPGHQVLHALILENAVYNLDTNDAQTQTALRFRQQRLTDVFYLQHDTRWKYDVLQRGVSLFGCLCNR
mmetsp:Transcript_36489/g.60034  ORF Transcript_36489/g.60034 Transcript_36489/m.60034 type:complete len:467 (-) Transcript_36489:149-1549(-)